MVKLISAVLFVLILYGVNFAQPKLFGYKISGNGDIISDVFLVQDGFILDSVLLILDTVLQVNKTYKFEYNEEGKLTRDINFLKYTLLDTTGPHPIVKTVPGYRHYFYNERGDIDSVGTGIWDGNPPAADTAGYRISYTYDNEGNILSKIYSTNGDTSSIENNSYDSSGNLILHKVIRFDYPDTSYNFREYDSLNRLTLKKSFRAVNLNIDQFLYEYDSSGNVNCTVQYIESGIVHTDFNYYIEFDQSGRAFYEMQRIAFHPDISAWVDSSEILFDYDEDNRILKMGKSARYHYNDDGNLDTFANMHPRDNGYLGSRATLVDSYGNKLWLPEPLGIFNYYYSRLVTDIKEEEMKVKTFTLSQNYPNPFNPTTTITYSLPISSLVTLKVYDILGKEIATLVNEEKLSGTYNVTWNASEIASGVYFYKITAGEYSKVNKMILLK